MLQLEVLILKLSPINALSSGAIVVCEIASLAHEIGNDSVEGAAFVPKPFLSSAEGAEVFWEQNVVLYRRLLLTLALGDSGH